MVLQIKETFLSSSHSPSIPSIPSPQSNAYALNTRISPSILLIIIILAVIFFISGLLHLLVRFLFNPSLMRDSSDDIEGLTVLQGQLQHLFHLHDSGLDQSFIDSLPIFYYKEIVGVKDPFDCAVCLSEFEVEDELRLLPKCSHAFHVDCIDTWLLSHSTCPICRASLAQDLDHQGRGFLSPVVRVLESAVSSENSRESPATCDDNADLGQILDDRVQKNCGIIGERMVAVKLGKFQNVEATVDDGGGAEARRCFSMGSFAYVLDEDSSLKVAIKTQVKKQSFKKGRLGQHRTAMSECGCDSRRDFDLFKVIENENGGDGDGENSKCISNSKRDSFSMSKIWLSGRRDRDSAAAMENSRRAFSFRLPPRLGCRDRGGGGGGLDFVGDDDHSSLERSLEWIIGRQNKVFHSTFSSNV